MWRGVEWHMELFSTAEPSRQPRPLRPIGATGYNPAHMPDLREHLQNHFGLDDFRPAQREVIEDVMAGKDVLCVMPTGAGKSLCYQLPAAVQGGLTIVVEFADGGDSVSLIGPFEKSWVDGPFFSQEIIAVRLDGRTLTLETRDAAMVAFWRGLG